MDRVAAAELFVEVVDAGGFSAAARRLGRTPSAVSKAVAAFEGRLGVRLLQRTTRRLSLTAEGQEFYERSRVALAELEAAQRAVADSAKTLRGRLRVSVPIHFCHYQLVQMLPDFAARHPEIQIDLDVTDRAVDLVAEGIDVAVRIGSTSDDLSLVRRRLAPNHRVLCASPAYLERRGRPQTPAELRFHDCLGFTGNEGLNRWPFATPEGTVEHRVEGSLLANNGQTLMTLALAGLGIARLSAFMTEPAIRRGELVALFRDEAREASPDIFILYPHRRHLSAKVRAFIDALVAHFQPVPPWERAD